MVWFVCLKSAEEFNLCWWLTLVFAGAKIRRFIPERKERDDTREAENDV